MPLYVAVTDQPYQYAGGVLCPGESRELSPTDAARGLADGSIVRASDAPTPTPPAAPAQAEPAPEPTTLPEEQS